MKVAIQQIKVNEGRRALRSVDELAKSIQELGLLNPITVREDYTLVAGYHRLEACKQLGQTEIEVVVVNLDHLRAQLAEIDENLVRNELTVLEHSQEMKRRKEIYEALHPETKRGVAGANASNRTQGKTADANEIISFASDTAAKIGSTPRTVQTDIQIADSIPADIQEILKDTPIADNKTGLLELARMSEKQQREIAPKLASGDADSIKELKALQQIRESGVEWLVECVNAKRLKARPAVAILAALDAAPVFVRQKVNEWNGISEPGIVNILERLYFADAETWHELIATSGYLQPGDELEARKLPQVTVKEFERYLEFKAKERKAAALAEKRQHEIQNVVDLAKMNEKFNLIYADPPWEYEFVPAETRAIENHYPTMDLERIKALDVQSVAADDCMLFMWATSPKLAEAMEVIQAWGFTYRTCAVWVKDRIGNGHYFRQRHELLLLAKKGDMRSPEPANRPDSVIEAPRGKHSEKPEEVYELIEAMYPEYRKIELFSRNARQGWLGWGNQYDDHSARFSDTA